MPLTPLQREIAQILARNRTLESHVVGGAAINRQDASPRYSLDLDIFHDIPAEVRSYAEADAAALREHGFTIEWLLQQPSAHRAEASRGTDRLKLEWCSDSPFRFFPVQKDAVFGYCLHQADLATNKVLALAGRSEIRDLIDVLYLHDHYLRLGVLCWAACGKDQGFTPLFLLNEARRNAKYREADLLSGHLTRPENLYDLKQRWLAAAAEAEELFARLPAHEVGCLYLDRTGSPVNPDPQSREFSSLARHFGCEQGARPKLDEPEIKQDNQN